MLQKELDSLRESKGVALHILTAGQDALCEATQSNILKRPSILAARQMIIKVTSDLHDVEKRIQEKVDELDIDRCIGKRASSCKRRSTRLFSVSIIIILSFILIMIYLLF